MNEQSVQISQTVQKLEDFILNNELIASKYLSDTIEIRGDEHFTQFEKLASKDCYVKGRQIYPSASVDVIAHPINKQDDEFALPEIDLKPGIYRMIISIQSTKLLTNESFTIAFTLFGDDISLRVFRVLNGSSSTGRDGNKLHHVKVKLLFRVVSPDDYNKNREVEVGRGMFWINVNRIRKTFFNIKVVENKMEDRNYSLARSVKIYQTHMEYVPVEALSIDRKETITALVSKDRKKNDPKLVNRPNTAVALHYSGSKVQQKVEAHNLPPSKCVIVPELRNIIDGRFQANISAKINDKSERIIENQGKNMKDEEIILEKSKNFIILNAFVAKGANNSRVTLQIRFHQLTGITNYEHQQEEIHFQALIEYMKTRSSLLRSSGNFLMTRDLHLEVARLFFVLHGTYTSRMKELYRYLESVVGINDQLGYLICHAYNIQDTSTSALQFMLMIRPHISLDLAHFVSSITLNTNIVTATKFTLEDLEKKLKMWRKYFLENRQNMFYLSNIEQNDSNSITEKRILQDKDMHTMVNSLAQFVFTQIIVTGPIFRVFLSQTNPKKQESEIHPTPTFMHLSSAKVGTFGRDVRTATNTKYDDASIGSPHSPVSPDLTISTRKPSQVFSSMAGRSSVFRKSTVRITSHSETPFTPEQVAIHTFSRVRDPLQLLHSPTSDFDVQPFSSTDEFMFLKNLELCATNIYRLFCLHECDQGSGEHDICVMKFECSTQKWANGFCKAQEIVHLSKKLIGMERKDKKTSMIIRRQLLPTLEGIFCNGFKRKKKGWFSSGTQHVWEVIRDMAYKLWEEQGHLTEKHLTALRNGQTYNNESVDNLLFIYYAVRSVEENHSIAKHRSNNNTKLRAFFCTLLNHYTQKALKRFFAKYTSTEQCMRNYEQDSILCDDSAKRIIYSVCSFLSELPFCLYVDAERNFNHDVVEE